MKKMLKTIQYDFSNEEINVSKCISAFGSSIFAKIEEELLHATGKLKVKAKPDAKNYVQKEKPNKEAFPAKCLDNPDQKQKSDKSSSKSSEKEKSLPTDCQSSKQKTNRSSNLELQ